MIVRRLLRLARRLAMFVIGVLVVLAAVIVGLWATNPDPAPSAPWTRLPDMPEPRGEVAAARSGDRFVVVGGLTGFSTSDATTSFDISDDRWTVGAPLPEPRHHAAAAAVGGWIYVSGGASGVFDWTPKQNLWRTRDGRSWETMPSMPEGRQGHDMVALDGRLYVVGGVGPSDRTLIHSDGWRTGAALPFGRDHLRAVAWDGKVWALGGRIGDEPTTHVHVYDPEADAWTTGPELPEPMSAMAVGVLGDGLHVIGGEDPGVLGGSVSRSHLVLTDPGEDWRRAPEAILAVHGAGYATTEEALIVAGGASRQGALSAISFVALTQAYPAR